MVKKNALTAAKKLEGDSAAKAGDMLRAQVIFAKVCKLDPVDTEAWTKLSVIEKGLGNFQQAESCARRALVLDPKLAYGHFALGQALHSQSKRVEAMGSYRTAITLMPDFADSHYLLGLALHESGNISDAISSFQQSLLLRPVFPEVLAELGAIHLNLGNIDIGLDHLQRSIKLRPFDAAVLGNISHAMRLKGLNKAAIDNFRHAMELLPDNVDLIAGLAGLLEKMGNAEEAQRLLDRGLQIEPMHVMSNLVAAQLDRRGLRLQAAVDRLQGLLVPTLAVDLSAEIMLELGQIYDQMGNAGRAYPLIVEGKRRKALATLDSDGGSDAYLARLARIRQFATPALSNVLRTRAEQIVLRGPEHISATAPVFLIGFPRSGTTLMEQILDSHPNIQAMEEKSTVSVLVNRALDMLGKGPRTLEGLTDDQLNDLHQLYFSEVNKYINLQPGNLLIDKMPLNTVGVPVIARVFPKAKFILAIRHPCDVCLSCLMQNFATNAGMANFFTLEDTAHLYAQVMGAWLHYAELLPLNYHRIRYEDLIEDVPTESQKLLAFLGLPWDDAVLKHTEHARQRGAINTPSYHQVVQPVYQRSKYRWKRYEHELAKVMPVLQPYIEKFGYT